MNTTCKKSVAVLLVLLQLIVLLPFTVVETQAVDTAASGGETVAAKQPKFNPVYFGTVQFGTFNYTSADESAGLEAADYVMPFVYTDDYFASSAINLNASAKEMPWTALEDKSLTTTSMDFAMACFGSNEEITDEADYNTDYDKNGREFLAACAFENIESNNYVYDGSNQLTKENQYNKFPTKDSVGVIVGSKDITVWTGEQNETYTLVAVGVRGAGYGAEWASNLTLGTSGEHQGFRESANKVEYMLDDYMSRYGIVASDHVKFWVVGYSRAGAVANLVAGDLSRNSKYNVAKANVYGYTFESAAGADATVDPNGTQFPNIHNIISRMDAVPRVSMSYFGNNRYGVDYIVPYHGNADSALNEDYYNRMYNTLKTIAQGYGGEEDPVVTNAHPDKYPYNRKVDVYELSLSQIVTDTSSLGLKKIADDSDVKNPIVPKVNGQYQIYIDDFLDQFVERFAKSKAWDLNTGSETDNAMTHRQKYVTQGYQEQFRTLVGAMLGTPGMGLNGIMGKLQGAIGIGLATKIKNITSITEDINAIDSGKTTRWSLTHFGRVNCYTDGGENLAEILKYILNNADMFDSATLNKVNTAVDQVSPAIFALFARDHANYSAQYTGTLLKYAMDVILVAHTPELDVSWQMAMDENYVNSYRTIELSKTADVKMYAFRENFEGALPENLDEAVNASGALVASYVDGTLATTDQRIVIASDNGDTITLRYPGTMDYRFDITGSTDGLQVTDLQPVTAVNAMAHYDRAANGNIIPDSRTIVIDGPDGVTQPRNGASANAFNGGDHAIAENETLHVMAWHGTNSLDKPQQENTYDAVKTASCTVTWVDADGETVLETDENVPEGTMPVYNGEIPTKAEDSENYYVFSGWTTPLAPVTGDVTYIAKYEARPLYYNVKLYYQVGDEAECVYTSGDYRYTKSVKLTAEDEYTKDGATYYFSHWDVDGTAYPAKQITVHPGVGGITVNAKAVYVENAADAMSKGEAFVQIVKVETETIGPDTARLAHKWVFTLSQSVPDGEVQAVGFVVSQTNPNPTPGAADAITATSTLQRPTSTFTTRVDVTGVESQPLYVRAYLTYNNVTIYSDEPAVMYTFPTE